MGEFCPTFINSASSVCSVFAGICLWTERTEQTNGSRYKLCSSDCRSKTLTFLFSLSLSQVVIKMVPVTSQLKRTDSKDGAKDGTYMEMKNPTGKCKV